MKEKVATLFNKRHGIMVNSGSSALLLAIAAFGLAQLSRLQDNIAKRVLNFKKQNDFFKDYENWFILPNLIMLILFIQFLQIKQCEDFS